MTGTSTVLTRASQAKATWRGTPLICWEQPTNTGTMTTHNGSENSSYNAFPRTSAVRVLSLPDTLPRLRIMKGRQSDFRLACTKVLLQLVGERAANANASRMREVGKILEKLDPWVAGMHSSDTVTLLRNLCTIPPASRQGARDLSIDHPDATDLFLELLNSSNGQPGFEKIALMALGIEGRYKRRAVAEYLHHLQGQLSIRLRTAAEELLAH